MTKRSRLAIHAGQHKTGTSYLQYRLSAERAYLKQNGVLYPEQFVTANAHHKIADMLLWQVDTAGLAELKNVFAGIRSEFSEVIISTEKVFWAFSMRRGSDCCAMP